MMKCEQVIRVKVLTRDARRGWERQLPGPDGMWGSCRFLFDPDERDYHWLVVYDDLPPGREERRSIRVEKLACPRAHTMLVTTEPSSIKSYGSDYVAQFGCVLTSQEEWALPHRDRIYSQPALRWYYGVGSSCVRSYGQLAVTQSPRKCRDISMVWSSKKGRDTWRKRHTFMCRIREALPGLEIYGKDVRYLDDKAEALDDYRYHIAIENHAGLHHWTEKLADSFLGFALPFYYGCENVTDYFPAQSLIQIDINDFEQALSIITNALESGEYEKRLPYILEARRKVMEEYNFMAVVSREIKKRHEKSTGMDEENGVIYSRYALRKKYPVTRFRQLREKTFARIVHVLRSCGYR